VTVRRTAARSLGVFALTAPLASVGLLTAPAALAATASSYTTPAAGSIFSGAQEAVNVTASVPACATNAFGNCSSTPTTTLSVTSNGVTFSATPKKWTKSASSITATIPATAANGTWAAALSDGGTASTRSFSLDFDTTTPAAFRTQVTDGDDQDVAFYWATNPESDITKYVLTENGTTLFSGAPSAAGCTSSSTCSTSFAYSAASPGDHTYQLVAVRPGASSSHISNQASTTAALKSPPKPTPSAAPAPTAGPTSSPAPGGTSSTGGGSTGSAPAGGSPGGSGSSGSGTTGSGTAGSGTTGGSAPGSGTSSGGATAPQKAPVSAIPSLTNPVVQQRRAFALTFNSFSPSLGIPKLPPLPSTDGAAVAGAEPKLADGTYGTTLPYAPQTETTSTSTPVASEPTSFAQNVLDSAQLAKSIAAALILMLAFGHLRRFLAVHSGD
jgi:uncharacterized membrane protein YgcG